jgi:hypothetical protein
VAISAAAVYQPRSGLPEIYLRIEHVSRDLDG